MMQSDPARHWNLTGLNENDRQLVMLALVDATTLTGPELALANLLFGRCTSNIIERAACGRQGKTLGRLNPKGPAWES